MKDTRRPATLLRFALLTLVFAGTGLLYSCGAAGDRETEPAAAAPLAARAKAWDWRAHSAMPPAEGAACVECHREIVEVWQRSQHALANRLVADSPLRPGQAEFGGDRTEITGALELIQQGVSGFNFVGAPVAVIGVEPLVQALVPAENGRWQVFNPAYHPEKDEWFNAFPEVRSAGEWGHWTGRGMNWNAQCAWCHTTRFEKNYDPDTDSYDSRWQAMGISCTQCHGDQRAHAADPERVPGNRLSPELAEQNCWTCHARRGFLTPGTFQPGDKFHDHFRLALFDAPGTYYPDGQVRDENFEAGSFLSSRMHDAGVRCMDCHDPHAAGLKLPADNNLLCMSCHAPPGQRGALPILPTAHSHHAPDSLGNRCVECHMPKTVYMQADPRRDHGFTSPDPQLTRLLGIPNACNRCHEDQTVAWAEEWAEKWYGEALAARRTRPRAFAIQAAWEGEADAGARLVALARTETNGVWRASLTRMLAPYLQEQPVAEWVQSRLRDEDELVRAAAVHVLSSHPAFLPRLAHLRTDPSRLVRLDAAWATRDQFDSFDPAVAGELAAWLRDNADQPSGALQMAQFALSRGDHVDTERWADRLLRYDNSGEPVLLAARLSHAAGDATKAAARLEQALTTRPEFVEAWFMLGMIRGEVGDTAGAMEAFRRVVLLDPAHGRAWYNLGLAQIRTGNANAGLIALAKAERSPRETADAAYAIATVHAGAGEWELARAALARALAADPNHLPALRLRAQLPPAPR